MIGTFGLIELEESEIWMKQFFARFTIYYVLLSRKFTDKPYFVSDIWTSILQTLKSIFSILLEFY